MRKIFFINVMYCHTYTLIRYANTPYLCFTRNGSHFAHILLLQCIDNTKADNIIYNEDENYIQLTSNGSPIGDKIALKSVGTNVVSIQVNEDGELIVNYSDGTSSNIGKVGDGSCVGTYIPSYSEDGILTFTLSDKIGETSYSFDIDESNNWNPVGEENSSYIWEKL